MQGGRKDISLTGLAFEPLVRSKPVVSSTELLDTDGSVLLDDEHAATLRDRLDHVARQTENGGFAGRAVAGDERATYFEEPAEDATQPGRDCAPSPIPRQPREEHQYGMNGRAQGRFPPSLKRLSAR